MISALILAAAAATATPSTPPKAFSGGNVQPIHGTPNPLLKEAAPKPNYHATAGPLLRKAAPGASANPQALQNFSGATTQNAQRPGVGAMNSGNWGWFGLFGVLGLVGLWRRYSGM
jgi:hypothetical protein